MRTKVKCFLGLQLNRLRRPAAHLVIALFLVSLMTSPLFSQPGPSTWFFELDGDYGSVVHDFKGNDGDGYLPAKDIRDGGVTTWGRRQNELCTDWHHVGRSYMGNQAYRVVCAGDPHDGTTRRSEQMLLSWWYAGDGTDPDTGIRYFSLAFKLYLPDTPLVHKGYIAQLHQGGKGPPPFALAWMYEEKNDGYAYFVHMGTYYDGVDSNDKYDYFYTQIKPKGLYYIPSKNAWTTSEGFPKEEEGSDARIEIKNGVWYRMLFAIDPGPTYDGELPLSPKAPGDKGTIKTWIMDNGTGLWVETGEYAGRIGYWYDGIEHTTVHEARSDTECSYQWKVGIYRNNLDPLTYYYDNISYAKRWYGITNNYLIGYHRSVLRYSFDEGSGTIINDGSLSWNTKRPIDYDNDGEIVGDVSWNSDGVSGKSLKFKGAGYVHVPKDAIDFDFGNYLTTSVWFRTTANFRTNRGLFTVDNYGDTWKVLLYLSDSLLAFGVRHPEPPDDNYSKANYSFTDGKYADGEWHHAVGTFNRFAPDGKRVKLYLDGKEVMAINGKDLPILRCEDFLTVGRFSSYGYFVGDIDEVNVFNYAMTSDEVAGLYNSRGAFLFWMLAVMRAPGGGIDITWDSRPGDNYSLQSCFDLETELWNEEATISSHGDSTTWTDSDSISTRKFYRIELK